MSVSKVGEEEGSVFLRFEVKDEDTGMDGYTAAREIRGKKHIPASGGVPVIAMTANVFREDIERCLAAGMNDHVGKPVNAEEILAKMKRFLPVGR